MTLACTKLRERQGQVKPILLCCRTNVREQNHAALLQMHSHVSQVMQHCYAILVRTRITKSHNTAPQKLSYHNSKTHYTEVGCKEVAQVQKNFTKLIQISVCSISQGYTESAKPKRIRKAAARRTVSSWLDASCVNSANQAKASWRSKYEKNFDRR